MKLKYVSWLPAVIIMIIIFYFSSKPADNSNENSMTMANKVLTVYEDISGNHFEERIKVLENLNHIVRKGAHFSEYAILAMAFAFHFAVLKKKRIRVFFLPILLSCIYALTDEFHQTFIPGRSGMIQDVFIDTTGAIAGTLVFALLLIVNERGQKLRL